jgi:hypothetical protein
MQVAIRPNFLYLFYGGGGAGLSPEEQQQHMQE